MRGESHFLFRPPQQISDQISRNPGTSQVPGPVCPERSSYKSGVVTGVCVVVNLNASLRVVGTNYDAFIHRDCMLGPSQSHKQTASARIVQSEECAANLEPYLNLGVQRMNTRPGARRTTNVE